MRKHFNIKISGKVQGVFFRASAKEAADTLNIAGLAKNEGDGSVYVEAEGDEEMLKQFVQWCHEGPPRAQVVKCEVREGSLKGFSRFTIER